MADHGWTPCEYLDEVSAPPRPEVNDWIVRLDDGAPGLAGWEDDDSPSALNDGQIVEFSEYQDYGDATLTVHNDHTFTVDRPMPPGANVVNMDFDNIHDSVERLVTQGGGDGEELDPGEYDLQYYFWSEPMQFRFDTASGSFIRVEAGHA